jgi:hypothetical protein
MVSSPVTRRVLLPVRNNLLAEHLAEHPDFGEAFMSNIGAAAVCAAGLWIIVIAAAYFEPAKRPAGEAWVLTASEKMPSRPMLVRANVPFKTADIR